MQGNVPKQSSPEKEQEKRHQLDCNSFHQGMCQGVQNWFFSSSTEKEDQRRKLTPTVMTSSFSKELQ